MNLILIWSPPINIQGRESYLAHFLKHKTCKKQTIKLNADKKPHPTHQLQQQQQQQLNLNTGFQLDIFISFKLGVMIHKTELCILIPVWVNLTFILGHSCTKMLHLQWELDGIQYGMLSYLDDLKTYDFSTGLCSDVYEAIFFKRSKRPLNSTVCYHLWWP